jgi:peptide deformylase
VGQTVWAADPGGLGREDGTVEVDRDRPATAIAKFRSPELRRPARDVRKVNARIREFLEVMADVMYAAGGAGLAGPQVGLDRALVVIDVGNGLVMLVNPRITAAEGSRTMTEGCLSLPGIAGEVERAEKVKVEALNEHGHPVWIDAEGFYARAIQHELDHLRGCLFVDRALSLSIVREEESA